MMVSRIIPLVNGNTNLLNISDSLETYYVILMEAMMNLNSINKYDLPPKTDPEAVLVFRKKGGRKWREEGTHQNKSN
jgi:hypothetical protein